MNQGLRGNVTYIHSSFPARFYDLKNWGKLIARTLVAIIQRNNFLGGTAHETTQDTLATSFTLRVSNGPVRAGAAPLRVPSANVRVLATSVTLLV